MFKSIKTTLLGGVIATAALPAFAQDAAICGGISANGQWLGGEEATSDISTSPAFLEQMALVLMRNEYVGLFSVSEAGDYRIEAEGSGGGDTVIDVRNADGEIIASDDDGGGNMASRAETYLEPGAYCVSLRSFDGAPLTAFVRVGRMDHETLTEGFDVGGADGTGECDPSQGVPLTLGQPVSNTFDQQSTYVLDLAEPTAVTFTAENQTADPILTIFDPAGNWLAQNDDFDGLNSRIDMANPLPAGQYCIQLDLYGERNVPITVTAKEYDAQEVLMNLYSRGEASPPLDGSYPVEHLGVLETRERQDLNINSGAVWYSFDVPEGGLVLVEAIAQGNGDPVLYMYDDLGRQVGYNDDAGGGSLNSLLTTRVQAGTYLVAVRHLDNSTQGFIRMVFERYVPAQ